LSGWDDYSFVKFDKAVNTRWQILQTMKTLKLDDDIFSETEKMTEELKVARNRYINDALKFFNDLNRKRALKAELQKESRIVSANSIGGIG
jgi:hypothetical protein